MECFWRAYNQFQECYSEIVTLSVTKANSDAGDMVVQDMLYTQLVKSLSLLLELPIFHQIDNIGAAFLAYNWCVTGQTRYIDIRTFQESSMMQGLFIINMCLGMRMIPTFLQRMQQLLYLRSISQYLRSIFQNMLGQMSTCTPRS